MAARAVEADARAGPEHQVLEHRERRDEAHVLVDHADAQLEGVPRRVEPDLASIDADVTLVGLVQARQDGHQGGLAGAVLTQEAQHLARHRRERDVVVGDDAGKALVIPMSSTAGTCSGLGPG